MEDMKITLARIIMVLAVACGVIGLIAGLADKSWKLEPIGWFTGGTLLAVLCVVMLADHYFATRNG